MLLNYSQFLIRQAVRSPMHLTNPRLVSSEDVALPRDSVIHYLEYDNDEMFPLRSLPYLSNVRATKRIPIWHITQLERNVDTTVPGNRTLHRQLHIWRKVNTAQFKVVELLNIPNSDIQTHSIFNYQSLKSLYLYKSSATANLNRYRNVYATYWNNVHKAIGVDSQSEHFVHIPVPSLIPSKALLDNILKYPDVTFARIVRDPELNGLVQLYQYLNKETRDSSVMSVLTEQDCTRITVELTHKGYSCFFKLSFLVGLAQDSSLESKRKISIKQLQRLFLLMMLKIQQNVYDLQNSIEDPSLTVSEDEHPQLQEVDDDSEEAPPQEPVAQTLSSVSEPYKLVNKTPLVDRFIKSKSIKNDNNSFIEIDNFSDSIDQSFSELEGGSDEIFTKLMTQAQEPIKEIIPKEVVSSVKEKPKKEITPVATLTADYSVERKKVLLKTKSLEENFQVYIDSAKTSGAISTIEARSLKKIFETRKTLKSPYRDAVIDVEKQIQPQDVSFTSQDTVIHIDNNLVDDELKSEVLFNFDRLYLKKLLQKDVLGCVTQIEAAGIVIKDYNVEKNESALGAYEVHKLTLKPHKGKESTVYFRLPIVNEEGEFCASGIKYRMRKQRQD